MTTDLILQGRALPTFLLDKLLAATGARQLAPCPPQVARFSGATRSLAFEALIPQIETEGIDWAFMPA